MTQRGHPPQEDVQRPAKTRMVFDGVEMPNLPYKRKMIFDGVEIPILPRKRKMIFDGVEMPTLPYKRKMVFDGVEIPGIPGLKPQKHVHKDHLKGNKPHSSIRSKKVLKRLLNVEQDVLRHRNRTVVMPTVGAIAQELFPHGFRVLNESASNRFDPEEWPDVNTAIPAHKTDPTSIEWVQGTRVVPRYYRSVDIDGIIYSVGDTVMVEKGHDNNDVRERNASTKRSQSNNKLANTKWFCRIQYMFETHGEKMFHAQWFQHGSQILLQETAHPQGLFLINECDDLSFSCIYQKCNLRSLGPDEEEPLAQSIAEDDNKDDTFFTSLLWDPDRPEFVDVSESDYESAIQQCKYWKPCLSCGQKAIKRGQAGWTREPNGGISRLGTVYHAHDFVYLRPSRSETLRYDIAQIIEILFNQDSDHEVAKVRLYGRYDDVLRREDEGNPFKKMDDRRLFWTAAVKKVSLSEIEGKAFVMTSNDGANAYNKWVVHGNHYYADQFAPSPNARTEDFFEDLPNGGMIPECAECLEAREDDLHRRERLLRRNGPLRGLELYAGAGGLSTGLELAGFVKTRWAVEFSPSAALTYEKNHPDTTVYCQCSNLLLEHAVETFRGRKPKPLYVEQTTRKVPPMPMPGQVDFIYGGPPCQSFSEMNHQKYTKPNDVRTTLVANMISYVEFYRPSYFLLENVVGFLLHPLGAVKMGVVKFVLRSLTCLGYQVAFKVLQAGQYGAPQSRRRVIFWGAKKGFTLPRFPVPTHCFPKSSNFNLPTGDVLFPPSRSAETDEEGDAVNYLGYAPLTYVTVEDAIGDLPPFDWINPHGKIPMTDDDFDEVGSRIADGIPRFDATISPSSRHPGFPRPVPYAHEPLNRYQAWVRKGASAYVQQQYTRRLGASLVERVTSVPLVAGANHTYLPRRLRMPVLFHENGEPKGQYRSIYERIDGKSYFKTALTTVAPNAKGGNVLHPTQKRILTVRECARGQGFPDRYVFDSVNTKPTHRVADQHRQVGNAVPIPLALALGRSLADALVEHWEKEENRIEHDRQRSPEVFDERGSSPSY